MHQVRQQLGPNASVLHIREVKSKRRFGRSKTTMIEVDASADVVVQSRFATTKPAAFRSHTPAARSSSEPKASSSILNHRDSNEIESEQRFTPGGVETTVPVDVDSRNVFSDEARRLYQDLIARGMDAKSASELIVESEAALSSNPQQPLSDLTSELLRRIAERLKTGGAVTVDSISSRSRARPRVVAFVGPTGVGKTTTMSKVASQLCGQVACSVGLVTMDTSRHGAVDQLLYFAEQLSAPLEIVSDPRQLAPAFERLQECDAILIDTPGRPSHHKDDMNSLRGLLRSAQPDTTFLVLDACSSLACSQHLIEAYSMLEVSHLIISKLDEAVDFGRWFSLLSLCQLPVGYMACGQSVPEDILVATPERLSMSIAGTPDSQNRAAA